ncbi:hypothetical protein D3C72_2291810 [compost metagenome]
MRSPDSLSSSAFVLVAMMSVCAGVYQRVRLARMLPCCAASWLENRMSVPNAVFSLCLIAS